MHIFRAHCNVVLVVAILLVVSIPS